MLQWIIPLSEHIRNSLLVIQACVKDSSMFKKFDVLPMFAMTKSKTIAIRYNADDNEVSPTSFPQEVLLILLALVTTHADELPSRLRLQTTPSQAV